MIRVLVCDETAGAAHLCRLLEHERAIDVVARVATCDEARRLVAAERPDLLTVSLDLPPAGGLELVEELMATAPVPIVVAGTSSNGVDWPRAALAAGALDTIARDAIRELRPDSDEAAALRRRLCRLAGARVIRHPRGRLRPPARPFVLPGRHVEAIGIVASTGGPPALRRVVAALPAAFPVPILVVQHMSAGFTRSFTDWLAAAGGPRVTLAEQPRVLEPGVWVAPEGAHLVVADGAIELDTLTPATHTPSGDVLLESIARTCGAHSVAVVLSGMGNDGARGVRGVRAAGGVVIAQDESTSAIFGMPRAAAAAGADVVLPLDEIAPALLELAAVPA
jgi:two-component system chemotaxis response regulator CheB